MMNIPYNNYKTNVCKYYEQSGGNCKFGKNCSFAHGAHELRNPYDSLPIGSTLGMPNPTNIVPPFMGGEGGMPGNVVGGGGFNGNGSAGGFTAGGGSTNTSAGGVSMPTSDVKILLSDPTNDQLKLKIIEASSYIQAGQRPQGYQIIDELLQGGLITIEYPQKYNNAS